MRAGSCRRRAGAGDVVQRHRGPSRPSAGSSAGAVTAGAAGSGPGTANRTSGITRPTAGSAASRRASSAETVAAIELTSVNRLIPVACTTRSSPASDAWAALAEAAAGGAARPRCRGSLPCLALEQHDHRLVDVPRQPRGQRRRQRAEGSVTGPQWPPNTGPLSAPAATRRLPRPSLPPRHWRRGQPAEDDRRERRPGHDGQELAFRHALLIPEGQPERPRPCDRNRANTERAQQRRGRQAIEKIP